MRFGVFLLGMLFGGGLLLSGMTDPIRVQGFLDVFGHWDPTLVFVLGGAVLVSLAGFQWCKHRSCPMCSSAFQGPQTTQIDRRLIMGSVIFGIGWGIAGICPGPALVLLGAGVVPIVVFVLAMLAGMWVWQKIGQR